MLVALVAWMVDLLAPLRLAASPSFAPSARYAVDDVVRDLGFVVDKHRFHHKHRSLVLMPQVAVADIAFEGGGRSCCTC